MSLLQRAGRVADDRAATDATFPDPARDRVRAALLATDGHDGPA
jgi:hypothetical protein